MLNAHRFLLLLFVFFLPLTIHALEDSAFSDEPVEVTADRLEASEETGTLVFIGNAEAQQGDVTIYADRLTVHFVEGQQEVDKVVAEGKVRIIQLTRVATGERADFYRSDGRVVLSGQPKVTENGSFIEGYEITFFLNEKRSVATGGEGGRVNAVFQPKTEDKP